MDFRVELTATRLTVRAFPETVICHACNIADGMAKRLVHAPTSFSFAPVDIKQFIRPKPGARSHEIDRDAARSLWVERKREYERRIDILVNGREITPADNESWTRPVPLAYHAHTVSAAAARILEGVTDPQSSRNFHPSTWATQAATPYPYGRRSSKVSKLPPTQAAIERIRTTPWWQEIPDNWNCPCCNRSKLDTVQRTQKKAAVFETRLIPAVGGYRAPSIEVCSACALVYSELVKQASVPRRFVCINDVREVIVPQPQRYHETDPEREYTVLECLSWRFAQL